MDNWSTNFKYIGDSDVKFSSDFLGRYDLQNWTAKQTKVIRVQTMTDGTEVKLVWK
jgi:hypothetical protein